MASARIIEKDGTWEVAVQRGNLITYLSPEEVFAVLRLKVPGGQRD